MPRPTEARYLGTVASCLWQSRVMLEPLAAFDLAKSGGERQ